RCSAPCTSRYPPSLHDALPICTRPSPPDLMLKIVLFEIQRGRTSPAQWYQDTKENIALQWLGRGIRPARSVWYTFAFRVGPSLEDRKSTRLNSSHGSISYAVFC